MCESNPSSMPLCPLVFQGLTEQQKEFMEKQWAQQKEQFMGRQKSTYDRRFRVGTDCCRRALGATREGPFSNLFQYQKEVIDSTSF